MPREQAPSAVYVDCPDCREERLHTVHRGNVGRKGGYTLDATVECSECGRVHHTQIREPKEKDIPVIVSAGGQSTRSKLPFAADEEIEVGDLLTVDGRNALVTAVELEDGKRPESATAERIQTIWAKDYDQFVVKFTINMGHKTISKHVDAKPEDQFHVGDEHTFGRLRVTVHSIKVENRVLRRGSAPASEIHRVFAKPTRGETKVFRPEKAVRERQREEQERSGTAKPRGARFGARKAREARDRAGRSKTYEGVDEETE